MIRGFCLTTLFAVLATFAASASAQVTLQYKFPDGRKSTSDVRIKTSQSLTLAGNELVSGSEQALKITAVNGERQPDGTLVVKSKIEALKASVILPGGVELEFDSAKPDADPPGTQLDFVLDIFKATSKSTWEAVMSQDNRVVAIKGREAALAELPQNVRDAMKAQLDPAYLTAAANEELNKLPSPPVSPGDTWERTNTMRLDSGQRLTFTSRYTYEGPVQQAGKRLEKITSKTVEVEYSADNESPLQVLESDLEVTESAGVLLFDPAYGQFVSQQGKVQIKGTLKLGVNGMELPGVLDLTIENSTTLTEVP